MSNNFLRSFLTVIALLFFLPHQASASDKKEKKPIKIGAILHLTGDLAMQGVAFREGIELAADRINSNGGIAGRKLQVIFEDTSFNTSNVNRAAKKLIEQDKVSAGIISTFHETKTAGPLFERAKTPLLCLWDSTPELDEMGEYLFSIGTWLPSTGKTTAKYAHQTLKAKKAAVISTNREWSLRVGNDFARIFKDQGGEVVFHDSYNPGESDFRTLFLKIRQTRPDVLYAPVDDNIGAFFKQLKTSKLDIPIIQSDNLNQEWIKTLGENLEGVYQSQSMDPSNSQVEEMIELYQQKFGKKPTQLLYQAWGFDGLNVIAQAIENSGAEPSQIKKGIYDTQRYPGAIGEISISPEGSYGVGVSIFQVKNGQLENVDGKG